MCDKIQEGDEKFSQSQAILLATGCSAEHEDLDRCLTANEKDWRQCKDQVASLGKCIRTHSKAST